MRLATTAQRRPPQLPPSLANAGPISPLVIADRLITLAKDADRAGYHGTAANLVDLMFRVLDEGGRPN